MAKGLESLRPLLTFFQPLQIQVGNMSLFFDPATLAETLAKIYNNLKNYSYFSSDLEKLIESINSNDEMSDDLIITNSYEFDFVLDSTDTIDVLSADKLIKLNSDLENIVESNESECLTRNKYLLRSMLKYDESELANSFFYNRPDTSYPLSCVYNDTEISCSIKTGTTIFNLLVAKNLYFDKYSPPADPDECFIQVEFSKPIDIQPARAMAYAYLFELSSNLNLIFEPTPRPKAGNFEFDDEVNSGAVRLRPLLLGKGLFELESLFIRADFLDDNDFKALTYIKILEYISQTTVRKETNERIISKLYDNNALRPDATFVLELQNIFTELQKYNHDKESISATIRTCCKYNELKSLLTDFFIKKITKSKDQEPVDTISKIIVSTRNNIAHAKVNYKKTGYECPKEEMHTLCTVLKKISYQAIRWFSLQGEDIRIFE